MWNTSPFGSASHFANIGSWKAGSHTSNSLMLKAQSQQLFTCNTSLRSQLRDQTLCLSACDRFFSAAATKGWAWCNHDLMQRWRNVLGSQKAQASGRGWMLGIPKRNGRNGFLRQTWHINLCSGVSDILWTSAAQRLAATSVHKTGFFCSCNEGMGMMQP